MYVYIYEKKLYIPLQPGLALKNPPKKTHLKKVWMHLKVFLKLKKTLKPSLLGKKTLKITQKTQKKPQGWFFQPCLQLNPWYTDENIAWCFTLCTTPSFPLGSLFLSSLDCSHAIYSLKLKIPSHFISHQVKL
jgi:hypothetical protein